LPVPSCITAARRCINVARSGAVSRVQRQADQAHLATEAVRLGVAQRGLGQRAGAGLAFAGQGVADLRAVEVGTEARGGGGADARRGRPEVRAGGVD